MVALIFYVWKTRKGPNKIESLEIKFEKEKEERKTLTNNKVKVIKREEESRTKQSETGIPKPNIRKGRDSDDKTDKVLSANSWKKPHGLNSAKPIVEIKDFKKATQMVQNERTEHMTLIPTIDILSQSQEKKKSPSPNKTNLKTEDKIKVTPIREIIKKDENNENKSNQKVESKTQGYQASQSGKLKVRPERDELKEAEEFAKELKETEEKAIANAKSFMKPINLNIDSHARSKDESKRVKEREVDLVRKMCGEFRDVAKLNTSEEKEERQREMEKVRSAR